MRILLLEDDPLLGDGVREGLIDAGFSVDWLHDGKAGRTALQAERGFDALVLDLGLPGLPGLEVLRWLRGDPHYARLPVLVLTARDQISDRIDGLDAGADDYLVKPFALGELVARLHAILRRAQGRAVNLLQWRALAFDPAHLSATLRGEPLALTAMEARVLQQLLQAQPHYLSREQFEARLYGWTQESEGNALDVHLSHLRRKLGADAIENARGLGWRLAP
ncbi:two-component system, OmpR family, response regulator [Andreprevotia lacus DSM 23236]|jgi:two-component system response regulator QseB|uniref:Two-component system, OmpR family, response regulator n=1 Tax=Andreprevotia lacus DSM 23236 TaxID=1121001 RepID=A0A1W1XBC2_9NEIS|nr:response regulator transcription factor [Andreprevotia lacus]SMC20978.1 two-component system, OmpR family, response regulator [Andreprevotia lacus DSM 23236]